MTATIVVARQPVVTTVVARVPPEPVVIETLRQGAPGGNNVRHIRYKISVPALTWNISHNQNTEFLQIMIRDNLGNRHIANYNIIDANSISISFTEPMAGFVDIAFVISGVVEYDY